MFPSEKVWRGIHSALHTRRRWYGIGLGLLLITATAVTWVMLLPHESRQIVSLNPVAAKTARFDATEVTVPSIISTSKASGYNTVTDNYPVAIENRFLRNQQPEGNPVSGDDYSENIEPLIIAPSVTEDRTADQQNILDRNTSASPTVKVRDRSDISAPVIKLADIPVVMDNNSMAIPTSSSTEDEKKVEANLLRAPYTIESVVNAYKYKGFKRRLQWDIYFIPTVSYRSLTENTEFISAARYNSIMNGGGTTNPVYYSTDVNSVVNHKPDVGFKVGGRVSYPLSKWFSLTGGLQLSVSKYDIQAYNYSPEQATIALTTERSGTRTISAMSSYRTGVGYKENWLRNFYFSASLPLGMELKLSDGNRNYFGVGTTIQPTYVLDNRAYLISTDYKNYAEVPSLTRRWNLNTSLEFFSAHTTGKLKWRVGPQVHYQLMSSFIKNYPIKEHLFDFGLKLGITLQ
jgi:hypothetical protein